MRSWNLLTSTCLAENNCVIYKLFDTKLFIDYIWLYWLYLMNVFYYFFYNNVHDNIV